MIFLLLLLLSLVCTIFCAQENDPAGLYPLASPRLDRGLRQHFITPCRGLHITLPACIDRAMSPLRSAELFALPPRDRLGDGTLPRVKLGPRHQYRTH